MAYSLVSARRRVGELELSDHEDPAVEERWCEERRGDVTAYLQHQGVEHGRVGEWPAWHVAPYVSVWAIESKKSPGWVGWWVICGDLPTDYVSAKEIKTPREAVRSIAREWREHARLMASGAMHPDIGIGRPEDWPSLAPLLDSRASMLLEWADDDSVWEDTDDRPGERE
jgi:hypothetical protein